MACEFICDGCGKRVKAVYCSPGFDWHKLPSWFQRGDKDGPQDACSRECIDKIAEKTGKTSVILPV